MTGLRSLAVTVAIATLGLACCSDANSQEDISPAQKRTLLGEAVLAAPASGAAYRALKDHFPTEFEKLISRALEIEAATGDLNRGAAQARQELDLSMAPLRSNLLVAPTADMWNLIVAKSELTRALGQENAQFCASDGLPASINDRELSLETQKKGWADKAALYTAIAAGRDHPERRPALTAQDEKDYRAAWDRRLSLKYAAIDPQSTSLEVQCDIIIASYDAYNDIPKATAASMMARDMVESSAKPANADEAASTH